ncbi:MAG: nucleoside hydrolase [Bacteroidota bacterium]
MTSRRHFLSTLSAASLSSLAPATLSKLLRISLRDPLPLIIDADTANEVDDLFALAVGLLAPELNIVGVTSAQWHTSPQAPADTVGKSQAFNEDIMRLMDKLSVPHPQGSNHPMVKPHRAQPSDAAQFIIAQAMAMPDGEKLHVAILGPATNLASAVVMEPAIIPKVVANYLGFWHNPETNTWSKREFNTNNDPNAVDALINTPGLDFRVMTASTSQHLVFRKTVVDAHLKGKSGLGDYLVNRWGTFDRYWQPDDKEKTKWIMWDVALILALAYPEMATKKRVQSPHDNRMRLIDVYTAIDTAAMEAKFWALLDGFVGEE